MTTMVYALGPGSAFVIYISCFLLNLLEGFMTTSLRYQSLGYKTAWKRSRIVCSGFIISGLIFYCITPVICFTTKKDTDTHALVLKLHFCGLAFLLTCAIGLNNFHCKLLDRRFNKVLLNSAIRKKASGTQASKDSSMTQSIAVYQEKRPTPPAIIVQQDARDTCTETATSLKSPIHEVQPKRERRASTALSTELHNQR